MESAEFYINRIKADSELEDYLSGECDFDIEDTDQLDDDLEFLLEGCECGYALTPFGCDGSGGVYVLTDDGKVGYIDSEGSAGFVALGIRDFFSIITSCGYLSDWASASRKGCFDSLGKFREVFENSETPNGRDSGLVKRFIAECGLESGTEKLYEMFKNGIDAQPPLVIKAVDDDYVDSQPMFETE